MNSIFLIVKPVLIGLLKIIGEQTQLSISFGTAFACKISKVRNSYEAGMKIAVLFIDHN